MRPISMIFLQAMKSILYVCLIVAASLTAFAADKPDDAKALQGVWMPTTAELGGQALPDTMLKTISLVLKEGAYEVSVSGEPDKGTYTLDSTTEPKSMTIIGVEGPNRGKTFPAIYELSGDTLRVCYDLSGGKRPMEFKSAADTMIFLVTYNRKAQ